MLVDIRAETFLFEYFLYDTIMGKYTDREKMFYCLGEIWNMDFISLNSLYTATESDNVRDISTDSEYMRYRRIKQYNEIIGNVDVCSNLENQIIAIKGDAMKIVAQYAMQATKETTKSLMYKTLIRNAQTGNIIALRLLGVMECEGVINGVSKEIGLEYLRKAMKWADITSILAVLKYSNSDKQLALNMLKSATNGTVYDFLVKETKKNYRIESCSFNDEILLLRKVFDAKKANADCFNSMYARLVYSPVLTIKDKEKVLFSERKELLSEACDLPLHLVDDSIVASKDVFKKMIINRENEQSSVKCALQNVDLCNTQDYKPICLSSDSEYVLESYISEIFTAFDGVNVERIEISDLREHDFEPTKNNVFIRSLAENKQNILLLMFKGEINDKAIDLTKTIIRSSNRSKFRLSSPSVTLNLSSVLPICVADKSNAKKLNGLVDVITIAKLNEKEKRVAIEEILDKKSKVYKIKQLSLDDTVLDRISKFSIETIDRLVDKLIRERREEKNELNLTIEEIKPYLSKISDNNYGFGGSTNEG